MGTGTGDLIRRRRNAGLPEPEFAVTGGFQIIIGWTLAALESRPESAESLEPQGFFASITHTSARESHAPPR
jgi:hypothetical protein